MSKNKEFAKIIGKKKILARLKASLTKANEITQVTD